MIKVGFYIDTEWALGSIHASLMKRLYSYDIDCHMIEWAKQYNQHEIASIRETFDYIVTLPGIPLNNLVNVFGVSPSKVIAVAHGGYDIHTAVVMNNPIDKLHSYACISSSLVEYSQSLGINRTPIVVRNGIDFDNFYRAPATRLETIGYAGAVKQVSTLNSHDDWKRSYLANNVAQGSNTGLYTIEKSHFLAMPKYYSDIDCLLVTSTEQEACGLPLMEAAAAGRLPISGKIGILKEFPSNPGVIVPLDPAEYVRYAVSAIKYYKDNPSEFNRRCVEAQEYAREFYDWSSVIEDWANLFKSEVIDPNMTKRKQILSSLSKSEQTVVVVGACDGVSHDHLHPFIVSSPKWKTVFCEPVSKYFNLLKKNYEQYPGDRVFVNSAIMDTPGEMDIYRVDHSQYENGEVPYWSNGVSSFYPDKGAISTLRDKLVTETVNCITVYDLVKQANISDIDILQIDVEGADLDVFVQFWGAGGYRPKIIMIEVVHMDHNDLVKLQNILAEGNYSFHRDPDNTDDLIAIRSDML